MGNHLGEVAGLFSSFAWAVGSLIFSRVQAPAAALNLFKNSVATVLFLVSLAALAATSGAPLFRAGPEAWGWLAISSLVGIVIGDTAYLRSLQLLGPRRALVLTTFAPLLAALLGWWVLGESLTGPVWLGMAVTLLGITLAVREGYRDAGPAALERGSRAAAVALGFLAALCQALGAVWSKLGMRDLDALEASTIRLAIAAAAGILLALGGGKLGAFRRALFASGVPVRLAAASALGTFLGIWCSLLAFKHARLAVATTLTTLSPVFVIPLAWLFLGQRASPRAILAAFLAVTGVAIFFYPQPAYDSQVRESGVGSTPQAANGSPGAGPARKR